MRRSRAQHPAHDRNNLLGSFSLRVDNFGKTLAQAAVVIDLGEPEILIRHVPQLFEGPRDGQLPCPHIFQKPLNVSVCPFFLGAGETISSSRRRSTILAGILPDPA